MLRQNMVDPGSLLAGPATTGELRRQVTGNLASQDQPPASFLQEYFPEVLEKGRQAAENIRNRLEGRTVRRTYFFHGAAPGTQRPPVTFEVARVRMEDGGIVRIYDNEGTVRELPSLIFNFVYSPSSVICQGPDYTLLFEVV